MEVLGANRSTKNFRGCNSTYNTACQKFHHQRSRLRPVYVLGSGLHTTTLLAWAPLLRVRVGLWSLSGEKGSSFSGCRSLISCTGSKEHKTVFLGSCCLGPMLRYIVERIKVADGIELDNNWPEMGGSWVTQVGPMSSQSSSRSGRESQRCNARTRQSTAGFQDGGGVVSRKVGNGFSPGAFEKNKPC